MTKQQGTAKVEKNYITKQGYQKLKTELLELIDVERPKVVEIIHWAAKNGDRSENGDYIYGKRRLREIDRRIGFLIRRLDIASVVDPAIHYGKEQIFLGATVYYVDQDEQEYKVTILGVDEFVSNLQQISWISPVAKALLGKKIGDEISLSTPSGIKHIEILDVTYPKE